ncbi:MAG: ArsR family transcriptional regulator [candidate division KSB1 bacterium]|nr:ArsR family transcriptional regulator [candidate division KSB1 bacterium]
MSEISTAIAEELWQRFRLLAMIIDKTDSFVGMAPSGELPEGHAGAQAPLRWLQTLANSPEEVKAIAGDLVLRALRAALEPTNLAILMKLREQPVVSFGDLMQATQVNRLSLSERINDLIQAGLAVKEVQTGQVQGTKAAEAIVDFIQRVQAKLSDLIAQRFPNLRSDS